MMVCDERDDERWRRLILAHDLHQLDIILFSFISIKPYDIVHGVKIIMNDDDRCS